MTTPALGALTDALTISLWALMRCGGREYATVAIALWCLAVTVRTHVGRSGRRDTSMRLFVLSVALYLAQAGIGTALMVNPDQPALVDYLAYMVVVAILAALSRSWQLLPIEGDVDREAPRTGGESA